MKIGDLCLKERGRKECHELGESHTQHNAGDKAPTETITVSSAMIVATRPRPMPSTWYRPNSFCGVS